MKIRRATPADADELIRLRSVMLRSVSTGDWDDDWRAPAHAALTRRLAATEPTLAAFVADRPDAPGLAASAIGVIEERLGGPGNPGGRIGCIFSVVTDPGMRRRGYSRACMEAVLQWFRDEGVPVADLRASPDGEPLYTSLGFTRTSDPAMRMRL